MIRALSFILGVVVAGQVWATPPNSLPMEITGVLTIQPTVDNGLSAAVSGPIKLLWSDSLLGYDVASGGALAVSTWGTVVGVSSDGNSLVDGFGRSLVGCDDLRRLYPMVAGAGTLNVTGWSWFGMDYHRWLYAIGIGQALGVMLDTAWSLIGMCFRPLPGAFGELLGD